MATLTCTGNGTCLDQQDIAIYTQRDDITCNFGCGAFKCPNYETCGAVGPAWYFECNEGMCANCASMNYATGDQQLEDPPFPIPELEDEYDENPYDEKWDSNEIIEEWRAQCGLLALEREQQ